MSTPPLGPVDRPPPLDELVRAEDLERCLAPFVDDIVDELVEAVMEKGGRVVFVDNGTLDLHQRVAAILRY